MGRRFPFGEGAAFCSQACENCRLMTSEGAVKKDIYRKPTFTDIIIPNDLCHPEESKLAEVRFLYNRLDNYHLPPDRRQNEDKTIQQILHNNGYRTPARSPTHTQLQQTRTHLRKTTLGQILLLRQRNKNHN